LLDDISPGTKPAVTLRLADGRSIQIVVLEQKESLALWKGELRGQSRIFLTEAGLVLDGNNLRLSSPTPSDLSVAIYPSTGLDFENRGLDAEPDGIFKRFATRAPRSPRSRASFKSVQAAGALRVISPGKIDRPVATAPLDPDFEKAAVWRVAIPENVDLGSDPILRLHYVGDVARVMLDGELLTDDFYNGSPLDIGLRRHAPAILKGDLRIAILPLRKDAPVYMADSARPDFSSANSIATLQRVEIIPRYQVQLMAK
jgi:hypothetical protein